MEDKTRPHNLLTLLKRSKEIDEGRTDRTALRLCYQVAAEKSDDPKTKNGSLLATEDDRDALLIYGCNRLPFGFEPTEENLKVKDDIVVHAEEDVIFTAARSGIVTRGAILYCPWAICERCARAVIMAGLKAVVVHKPALDRTYKKYAQTVSKGVARIKKAGIEYRVVEGPLGGCEGLMNHEVWHP
jgi:deoxycytidylate deaminase